MAGTDYPVGSNLAVKTWSTDLMKEALKRAQALNFIGKDTNSICQIKTEVNKGPGDRVRFGIRQQLSGGGIQGDGTLEGNEEALETYTQDILIDQLRHAVRSSGKMSEQRVPFSVRAEARDGLADWWADRIDAWFFNQIAGNTGQADIRYTGMQATIAPDTQHIQYPPDHGGVGTAATAESSISNTTVDYLTLKQIDAAVEKSKLAKNAMRQVNLGGGDMALVLFMHPVQATQLRTQTSTGQWLDIQKAAMAGMTSTNSPLFTGALGMYNGVILRESTRIPDPGTGSNAGLGGTVGNNLRRAVLCGAQAAVMAFGRGYGKGTFSWKEEMFDYDNQLGVAGGCIAGLQKTRFNSSDFATIVLPTCAIPA
jgi:N4-gp56 family major capsid protein